MEKGEKLLAVTLNFDIILFSKQQSYFRFFLSDSKAVISGDLKKTPTKQHPTESAISDIPAEMPFLMEWKKNRDGTITGFISGSPSFADGERITTSKIANGALKSGEIVETGSGSKYFLF